MASHGANYYSCFVCSFARHIFCCHSFARSSVDDFHLEIELLFEADERDHDLRLHFDLLLRHVSGGFEDGAGLHSGDFRVGDAETAATVAEHGVKLMQSGDAGLHFFNGDAHFLRKVGLSGFFMRNEFVKGRVEKADGRRQAFEGFKDAGEVFTLIRKQLREGFFQKYFPDAVPLMPGLVQEFRQNPTSSLVTVKCAPWQWQNRILLIGDSAHAIVPFYGQGMNAGFEDCTILAAMHDDMGGDWSQVIPEFARRRKADGDAIAELAQRNFIEMRDLVADPKFLLRKKIAARLHERHPDFLPVYSMVTFSNTPYHIALREDDAQNELFRDILALDNVEADWAGAAVEQAFERWSGGREQ